MARQFPRPEPIFLTDMFGSKFIVNLDLPLKKVTMNYGPYQLQGHPVFPDKYREEREKLWKQKIPYLEMSVEALVRLDPSQHRAIVFVPLPPDQGEDRL